MEQTCLWSLIWNLDSTKLNYICINNNIIKKIILSTLLILLKLLCYLSKNATHNQDTVKKYLITPNKADNLLVDARDQQL